MRNTLRTICIVTIITAGQTLAASWFSDNFNDGVIDTTHWQYGGDGISESSGVLRLNRNSPEDYIKTAHTYSGNFVINLDIRLNSMNFNDSFHGITIADHDSLVDQAYNGFSFGFTSYNTLYFAVNELSSQCSWYSYGPAGSNLVGQWQHWTLERVGNSLNVMVNGQPVTWSHGPEITLSDNLRIYLPGNYIDGNGSNTGITSSDVDNFSIIPEPCTLLLLGLGAAILRIKARN